MGKRKPLNFERAEGRWVLDNRSFSRRKRLSSWLYGTAAIAVTAGAIFYGPSILRNNSPTEVDIRDSTAMLHIERDSLEVSCIQYDSAGVCTSYRNPRSHLPQIDISKTGERATVYTSGGSFELICMEDAVTDTCKTFKSGYIENNSSP